MSDQIENENQQTATPQEVRQYILAELEASKQTIAELSDEQLEEVAGGKGGMNRANLKSGLANGVGFMGISLLMSGFMGG